MLSDCMPLTKGSKFKRLAMELIHVNKQQSYDCRGIIGWPCCFLRCENCISNASKFGMLALCGECIAVKIVQTKKNKTIVWSSGPFRSCTGGVVRCKQMLSLKA